MSEVIKHYSTDNITVVWQPAKCSHSKICFHQLPQVFNPNNRPWVTLDGSSEDEVVAQVGKCPSGALSIQQKKEISTQMNTQDKDTATKVKVTKGGPLLVEGNLTITMPDGEEVTKEGMTALCRCGASANKPYCDGSHSKIEFDT
ncbi:(4Fe-4S)-binding protein [Cocleimonas sp. KMM 6892]|jgi:uncharacterized Fe-S cluster protein YjdI|uniref:(4Fe-4S)-binding protein n=1 Tax=unclassified Cocleimonas TaxID=2639732 RepID=UPI002DBE76F6|nr:MULTISPECIES: (4Fe-4S)-binding protein [unclassified Cocleimonas]MEB8432518.1 (4Fe-4S)-binding protein [Cocleimonas sp. KMM 6892]MEC4715377.1 (4Fe-4S)-binding protein [Cocleimonas sp. KMM 6895]MEC4745004.1 (4Fe-4S)-binding protein [Cocleimonas sp. KMM 6896]